MQTQTVIQLAVVLGLGYAIIALQPLREEAPTIQQISTAIESTGLLPK